MLVRQVVIPASPDQLWIALTEPESVSHWFGSQVEWDLRPGGRARFLGDDGTIRGGTIDAVEPGRHLSFRWWREHEADLAMSQVSYDLEAEEDGTRLTVTEQPLPTAPRPTAIDAGLDAAHIGLDSGRGGLDPGPGGLAHGPTALDAPAPGDGRAPASAPADAFTVSWTGWDSRLFACWARAATSASVGRTLR